MPKTNSSYRWQRGARLAGVLALTLGLSACSLLGGGCNCGPDATANAAAPTPRTPLVTRPIAYSQIQVAPPEAPPVPTGTLLYPWRLGPPAPQANTANPVVNAVELPQLAPAAAPPPPSAPEAAPQAQPAATPTAAPRASVQRRSPAAVKPKVARTSRSKKVSKAKKAKRPTQTAKVIKATPQPKASTQRTPRTDRLANQPLDCPNLLRTNPYLAKQLRCPGATGLPVPGAVGLPQAPAMGSTLPATTATTATYPASPGRATEQPVWLPGTGVPVTPQPAPVTTPLPAPLTR